MAKISKKRKAAADKYDADKLYPMSEAMKVVKDVPPLFRPPIRIVMSTLHRLPAVADHTKEMKADRVGAQTHLVLHVEVDGVMIFG